MTMLKFDYRDEACKITDADIKKFEKEGLFLNGEESFHSQNNQRVYSVLSEPAPQEKEQEGGSIA